MPDPRQVHIDSLLTNISVAYTQAGSNYIASRIFPVIPVQKQSDVFNQYFKSTFNRAAGALRAPGTESMGIDYQTTLGTYNARVYALHHDITDQARANADPTFNLDRDGTQLITQSLLLDREKRWANTFFQTGVWSRDVTPAAKWSVATSTPINDVLAERVRFKQRSGYRANTLVVSPDVDGILMNHPQIVDRIKYTSGDSVTPQIIARLLGVDNYIVADVAVSSIGDATPIVRPAQYGVYGVADDGDLSYLYAGGALLTYIDPQGGSVLKPNAGYTFAWNGYVGATDGIATSSFYMQQIRSTRIEVEMAYDQRMVCADMGTFFTGLI